MINDSRLSFPQSDKSSEDNHLDSNNDDLGESHNMPEYQLDDSMNGEEYENYEGEEQEQMEEFDDDQDGTGQEDGQEYEEHTEEHNYEEGYDSKENISKENFTDDREITKTDEVRIALISSNSINP